MKGSKANGDDGSTGGQGDCNLLQDNWNKEQSTTERKLKND
jgi:hypothetical protein